ncbi:RagB/SusD family nutrient uptake outer membrane protein [Porphyromonadaceae bacterium W3.11]|nr:RagB/SusD family nutrient uptake outer membrane protein [Porphyromonadaceae bacterium W3.11]
MKIIRNIITFGIITILTTGCDKFLDIAPKGQVIPSKTSEYRATLNQGYAQLPELTLVNMRGTVIDPQPDNLGLSLDEFETYKTIYTWADTDDNSGKAATYPYYSYYKSIFFANTIITSDAEKVKEDSRDEKFEQVRSEAYALRAYNYFELCNLYGPKWERNNVESLVVPINDIIDTEQKFPRTTLGKLHELILSDIHKALDLSKVNRYDDTRYRYRFSREAILALTSRIYLYRSEWELAKKYALEVLKISDELVNLNDTDTKLPTNYQSSEAIINCTALIKQNILMYMGISEQTLALYGEGDLRLTKYYGDTMGLGYQIPIKGTNKAEQTTIRRSEIYLTAAEACARLGENEEAKGYLLTLLKNRLTPEAYATEAQTISNLSDKKLISRVMLERQKELAFEGHDWYDYKRTDQPELRKTIYGKEYVLPAKDPRYTLDLPKEAKANNPLL